MLNKPLVSIITPTYNNEKYINQCIESIRRQSYPHFELLVIDDASTDKTPELIEKLAAEDQRIKLIRHEETWGINRLTDTYNQALDSAKGELIGIVEGDDFWPEDKLEKQIKGFENKDIVLSWGRAAFTDEQGKVLGFRPINKGKGSVFSNNPRGIILKELLYRNIIPAVSVLIRKDTLLSIGGFQHYPNLSYADYPTFLTMSLKGEFCFVDGVMGYWRRHNEQVTTSLYEEFAKVASVLAQNFVGSIPEDIKNQYGLTSKKVQKRESARITYSRLFEGRVHLANHRWKEARKTFKTSLKKAPFSMKFVALLGIMLSLCHIDLKPLVRSMDRLMP
jgi:glycosyltransferase involved in cell wall biosynthesis